MSGLDWSVLVAYAAAILSVAFYFRRRASRGVEDFFVAGRNLPWWVIGFADVAGYTGGGQAFVMVFFLGGFSGLWLMAWMSWAIWMPLVAVLWAPMWSRLGLVTTGEFISHRYAGRRAAVYRQVYGLYASLAWGVTVLAYTTAWMLATTTPSLGWPVLRTLIIFGGMTIAYSLVSGLLAVAYNDVLQFVILLAGNCAFGWLLISQAGGFTAVVHRINGILQGPVSFCGPWPTSGDQVAAVSLIAALCLQGLFFAGSPFAGEGWTAQRYMAARSELDAVLGQMLNGVLALVIRMIPFLLIGMAAAAIWTPAQVATPANIWGDLVMHHASAGLFGLLLICSLSGYMATIASIGNWAASFIINDVYPAFRPQAGAKELLLASRLSSAALLLAAFAWGSLIDAHQLEKWVLFINSALVVFPLPLAWLKWFWWRTNVAGDMVGILGAFPVGYVVWFGSRQCAAGRAPFVASHYCGLELRRSCAGVQQS